jgi:hypothetical protein
VIDHEEKLPLRGMLGGGEKKNERKRGKGWWGLLLTMGFYLFERGKKVVTDLPKFLSGQKKKKNRILDLSPDCHLFLFFGWVF